MLQFNPKDPLVQIGIVAVVFTIPAISSTIYRLWIRRGRYWADDAWALCSALSQFLMFSGCFIHITNSSPRTTMVAAYYLMAAPFYTVVWCARLSILFSIIRIDPSPTRRRHLFVVALFFFIIMAVLVTQLFWVCEPEPSWKNEDNPQCVLSRQVVVLQLVTDVIADTILIIAPLRLLRNLMDKKLRRKLTIIFSTCLITTAVSLVHAAFIFVKAGNKEVIAAITEDCVSLIVCNVPVVATSLIHLQQDYRKGNSTRKTAIEFASQPPMTSTIGQTTTTGTGWLDNFRWERELDMSETDTNMTSDTEMKNPPVQVQLSDTAGKGTPHEHVLDEEDPHRKASLRFQDG